MHDATNTRHLIQKYYMASPHWLKTDTLVVFNLQPLQNWSSSNCKINNHEWYPWIRLFKTISTTCSRKIYILWVKRILKKNLNNSEHLFPDILSPYLMKMKMVKITRIREMRRVQWCFILQGWMEIPTLTKFTFRALKLDLESTIQGKILLAKGVLGSVKSKEA